MKEQLIDFETTKLAKEKRFDIPVYYHYSENPVNDLIILCEPDDPEVGQGWILCNYNNKNWTFQKYSAPTQELLQKWLREVHKIEVYITPSYIVNGDKKEFTYIIHVEQGEYLECKYQSVGQHKTYEEALEIGLQEGLKLI
jgi:hypothetical protein